MLTVTVIEPLPREDSTFEDVDPEEGHEDNLSRWVMLKNSPRGKPRYDALIPTKSLYLNIEVLLAGSSIRLSITLANINKDHGTRYPI